MVDRTSRPPISAPFLWPLLVAASAAESTASLLSSLANSLNSETPAGAQPAELVWATPNAVALELPTMRLRNFSAPAQGPATLVCAPYALHGATISDFAPGHSIVEVLLRNGLPRVFVTDWRSATPDMRYFSIDTYLADLNVAVDELDPPVDLVGLCQGAWMALLYAARFPRKVRRLVLVAAPIDVRAGDSQLSRLVTSLPLKTFEDIVRTGNGRVLGQHALELWAPTLRVDDVGRALQISPASGPPRLDELAQRFQDWYGWTFDLPGTYYLQVVQCLFKENQIAEGRFVALGRRINLADVRGPVLLLAGSRDELISPDQLFAAGRLIGTPKADIEMLTEPCDHLGLFLGAETLDRSWQTIARWLLRDQAIKKAS